MSFSGEELQKPVAYIGALECGIGLSEYFAVAVLRAGHDSRVSDHDDRRAVEVERGLGGNLSGDVLMFGVCDLQQSFLDVGIVSEIQKAGFCGRNGWQADDPFRSRGSRKQVAASW
ncbi:hypothetical protein LBMAG46_01000 [Planctomycetia bacterium]|nr:hypothetical protein LBMAG46_01000 [Planctomycetia bacterium]